MLLTPQLAHGRRKVQSAVMRALIQSLGDALHGFDFDPFSRLQVYAPPRRCFVSSTRVRTQKHPADSPEQPDPNPLGHLQRTAVTRPDIAQIFPKSLPTLQL